MAEGLVSLGFMQVHGREHEAIQAEEALRNFKRADEMGNKRAPYHIGYMYECGIGVEKDEEKAIEYYEKASKAGYKAANYNLRQLRPRDEAKEEEDESESDFAQEDEEDSEELSEDIEDESLSSGSDRQARRMPEEEEKIRA